MVLRGFWRGTNPGGLQHYLHFLFSCKARFCILFASEACVASDVNRLKLVGVVRFGISHLYTNNVVVYPVIFMDDSRIREFLAPYGVNADSQLCERIRKYIELLLAWNRKISLTAVTEPDQIVRFHFGESLFAIKRGHVEKSRLADVGSGAGFPGLPLAMVLPELDVTLIESNSKKTAFLSEVVRRLGLKNVLVWRGRMESLEKSSRPFDFIVARALGDYEGLAQWAKDRLAPSGKLVLWVGEEDASKISALKGWDWETPIPIPNSRNRTILIGTREGSH